MEPFLGQIMMFAGNFAPRGWAKCDGQLLPINQYSALFSLLGTTYGGDGRTTFGLPDLRGRAPIHYGSGPGLAPVVWGQRGGSESFTLTAQNLPSHNHTIKVSPGNGDNSTPVNGNSIAASVAPDGRSSNPVNGFNNSTPDIQLNSQSVTNTGGNIAVNKRSPYLGVIHVIATVGIFPSRS